MPTPQALLPREHRDDDDPAQIRLLALPDTGPPFDDDLAARAIAETAAAPATVSPAAEPPLDDDPASPAAAGARPFAVSGTDGEWARRFAALLTEALSGARPLRQILPWTSQRARVQLPALMPLFGGGQRPRVVRVIATRPARDVIEMTVIAGVGARTRALAVRLQRADPAERPTRTGQPGTRTGKASAATATTRWLCTDIEAA